MVVQLKICSGNTLQATEQLFHSDSERAIHWKSRGALVCSGVSEQ